MVNAKNASLSQQRNLLPSHRIWKSTAEHIHAFVHRIGNSWSSLLQRFLLHEFVHVATWLGSFQHPPLLQTHNMLLDTTSYAIILQFLKSSQCWVRHSQGFPTVSAPRSYPLGSWLDSTQTLGLERPNRFRIISSFHISQAYTIIYFRAFAHQFQPKSHLPHRSGNSLPKFVCLLYRMWGHGQWMADFWDGGGEFQTPEMSKLNHSRPSLISGKKEKGGGPSEKIHLS